MIREAWQHGWDEELRAECGWRDDGRAMLALALTDPKRAAAGKPMVSPRKGARFT